MPFDSLPVTNPVIEALRRGRANIERGWCQYFAYIGDNRFCAMGALRSSPVAVQAAAIGDLTKALSTGQSVGTWNDAPDRTQADVLNLYDRAIELAVAAEMAG